MRRPLSIGAAREDPPQAQAVSRARRLTFVNRLAARSWLPRAREILTFTNLFPYAGNSKDSPLDRFVMILS